MRFFMNQEAMELRISIDVNIQKRQPEVKWVYYEKAKVVVGAYLLDIIGPFVPIPTPLAHPASYPVDVRG